MSWRRQVGWREIPGPRRIVEGVRTALTRDFGLKVLSLTLAFALWFFVNAGERDTEVALQVPLELRNIPADLMQISPRIDFVDLRVLGPRTLLARIDRDRLSLVLDVGGVRSGPATFRLVPGALNLPRGVNVVRLAPSEITLEWAQRIEKTVPVRLALIGKPPADLRVTSSTVAPEKVRVIGPADQVKGLKAVETEPVDLSDAKPGVLEGDVALQPAGEYVSYSASVVHMQVRLEEPLENRSFRGVTLVLRNATPETTVRPSTIHLTLRGPRSVIEALELDHGAVYIDASELPVGLHEIAPALDLPPEVEVRKREPATVSVQVRESQMGPPAPPARASGGER
jgi:YbbR domain-containing protein